MEVISHDQSDFLPMRLILNNIFLTHETIQWAKKSKQSLIFLQLDFSKAYNKVNGHFCWIVCGSDRSQLQISIISTNNTTQTLFRKRYVSSYKVLIAAMLKKIIQQSSDCNVCDENLCMFFSLFFIHVHGSE